MRKRVNLSLDEEMYAALVEYSEVIGATPTNVIHQVLQEVMPTFVSLTKIAKKANEDRSQAIGELQSLAVSKTALILNEVSAISSDEEQMELLDDND